VRHTVHTPSVRIIGTLVVLSCLFLGIGLNVAADEAPPPDLSGRWVMVQNLATYAVLPIVNEIYISTNITLLSSVTQDGILVTLQDAYCFTDLEVSTDLFVTEIPNAAMQSLQPDPRQAELVAEGDSFRLVQEWHTEVRGAVLDDPINDPLPVSPSDPRIFDQEGDGKLAMTIPAELNGQLKGETYVTQRFRYRLEGDVIDADTIIGLVEWTTEQTIVSATDAMFFMPFAQMTDPEPERNRFVMIRVDDAWDCETVREQLETLLALLPVLPERVIEEPAAEEPATP